MTLSSKSFSPFLHSTCALSVSGAYLALEGAYLPHSRCTPKQRYSAGAHTHMGRAGAGGHVPTLTWRPGHHECTRAGRYGAVTLHGEAFCACLRPTSPLPGRVRPTPHSSAALAARRFGAGLLPVRSPLLGESPLISSPPLINMLKSGGWSPQARVARLGVPARG